MKTFRQLINESLFLTEANYGARKEINNLGNAFRAAGNKTEKNQTKKRLTMLILHNGTIVTAAKEQSASRKG